MTEPETASTALAPRVAEIRQRIAVACRDAGRYRSEVSLVAVSKRQPLARVAAAVAAGISVLGENQVQEATAKSACLPTHLDWHLIGHLQSNKTAAAVRLFSTLHALDRPKIIDRVVREAVRQGRHLLGFLEVNVGNEASKHGFAPHTLVDTADRYAQLDHLTIVGLMAIPPFERDPEAARRWFVALRELRDEMAERPAWRDRATPFGALSMGMSHDFEIAIQEGATHVRVGTSLFGPRAT